MQDRLPNLINAKFITSAVNIKGYPQENLPELAFVGRSNVGKSSLINSLTRHNGLARVSSTPGKTQTLNFYRVTAKFSDTERYDFYLVDLPGYGFAKRGRETKHQWSKFIEEYITSSSRLKLVVQLIDSRHPPMESDRLAYQWLCQLRRPVQVVATKADKLSNNQLQKQLAIIKRELALETDVIAYSAVKGTGRDQLLAVIGRELTNERQTRESVDL